LLTVKISPAGNGDRCDGPGFGSVRTGDNGCEDLVCEDVARTCEGTYELVSILLMSCTASDVKSFGQISQAPIEISRIAYLWICGRNVAWNRIAVLDMLYILPTYVEHHDYNLGSIHCVFLCT
jgi:hypothetical protein